MTGDGATQPDLWAEEPVQKSTVRSETQVDMPARDDTGSAGRSQTGKSTSAFRTISEVAAEIDVPQHVLRFWETKFSQIRPLKRGGGRRYYRPEDVALLRRIRELLYTEGYTIKGVQKLLREGGGKPDGGDLGGEEEGWRGEVQSALKELLGARDRLRRVLR